MKQNRVGRAAHGRQEIGAVQDLGAHAQRHTRSGAPRAADEPHGFALPSHFPHAFRREAPDAPRGHLPRGDARIHQDIGQRGGLGSRIPPLHVVCAIGLGDSHGARGGQAVLK